MDTSKDIVQRNILVEFAIFIYEVYAIGLDGVVQNVVV